MNSMQHLMSLWAHISTPPKVGEALSLFTLDVNSSSNKIARCTKKQRSLVGNQSYVLFLIMLCSSCSSLRYIKKYRLIFSINPYNVLFQSLRFMSSLSLSCSSIYGKDCLLFAIKHCMVFFSLYCCVLAAQTYVSSIIVVQ